MERRSRAGSAWDLVCGEAGSDMASHADYEEVFVDAFLGAFGRVPSRARTAGYL